MVYINDYVQYCWYFKMISVTDQWIECATPSQPDENFKNISDCDKIKLRIFSEEIVLEYNFP